MACTYLWRGSVSHVCRLQSVRYTLTDPSGSGFDSKWCAYREYRGQMGYTQVVREQEEQEAARDEQRLADDDTSDSIIFES